MAGINKTTAPDFEFGENNTEEISSQELEEVTTMDISKYHGSLTNVYINKIKTLDLLTPEEEKEFAEKKDAGDKRAREVLINHNLRLVVAIAKKEYDHLHNASVPNLNLDDMIQDGSMGLITAVDRFDHTKNLKFSTYAVYWIKQSIQQGLSNLRPVRLPDHKINEIMVINRTESDLETILHRKPTVQELYLALDRKFTVKQVQDLLLLIQSSGTISLDKPVDDDEHGVLGDIISDDNMTPVEYATEIERHDKLYAALNTLSDRDKLVIVKTFGLDGNKPATLSETAEILYQKGFKSRSGTHISNEGIRHIKEKSLKMLASYLGASLPEAIA